MSFTRHLSGEKAYLDTAHGLVPCVVEAVLRAGDGYSLSGSLIKVRLTQASGLLPCGFVRKAAAMWVVPTSKVRRNRWGDVEIRTDYEWVARP